MLFLGKNVPHILILIQRNKLLQLIVTETATQDMILCI